jgi:hypothetical protein
VLLGALEAVRDERLPAGPWSSSPSGRRAAAVLDIHRRAVATLGTFADLVGAVVHGDPLGRYRAVALDPADLGRWALHQGGRWATVTDPFAASDDPGSTFAVVNARMLAATLTAEHLRDLLGGDGAGALPLVRYLATLRSAPAARSAFLASLGADGFRALVRVTSATVTSHHVPGPDEAPVARAADDVLVGLAGLWALDRAAGGSSRSAAWGTAVTTAPVYGVSRLVEAAATTGAATATELAGWGAAAWRGLVAGVGRLGWTDPQVIGDRILSAVSHDGGAARRFLLDLAGGRDRRPLVALVANDVSSPAVSGGLLLASTNPGTIRSAAEADEVRRSLQAVLPVIDRLLARGQVTFPTTRLGAVVPYGRVLPVGLGLYVGRQLEHLVDPADGAGTSTPGLPSRAWPGWRERQVSGVLGRLVADEAVTTELVQAARAGALQRLSHVDLLGPAAADAVRAESFVLGAADGLLGDRTLARAAADRDRFDAMVAGVDLVVNAVGLAVPVPGGAGLALKAWGPVSEAGAAAGLPSPSELLLSPFAPESTARVIARQEAHEGLGDAELKGAVATLALGQAAARGLLAGLPPPPALAGDADPAAAAVAAATRPGDNANAPAERHLAPLERWLTAAEATPIAATVAGLEDAVGDASAQGRRWVA